MVKRLGKVTPSSSTRCNVAMAVALPEGLVTPSIRRTDVLGVREIAAQAREFASKAKDGKLSNEANAGGTFNDLQPRDVRDREFNRDHQSTAGGDPRCWRAMAILGRRRGQLTVQTRMKMTMSCDHGSSTVLRRAVSENAG